MSKKDQQNTIPTDSFSTWLKQIRNAQHTTEGSKVPCNGCTACCESAYFIHIEPDETETLAKIPDALKFPAPGLPDGHVVLGYDEKGRCPMFIDNKCSIYNSRPRTCRVYDCRVFPATGLSKSDTRKTPLSQQVQRWRFKIGNEQDRKNRTALQAAAQFINKFSDAFPEGFIPKNITQQAMLAIKVYKVFLKYVLTLPDLDGEKLKIAKKIIDEFKRFEKQT